MKLLINGITISNNDYSGRLGTVVNIKTVDEETGEQLSKTVSQEYTFTGAAYDLIAAELIDTPTGNQNFMTVKIFEDDCCDTDILLFEGIIRGDSLKWCYGQCEVTAQFFEHTVETKLMDCARSTIVDDNWNGFKNASHPRVVYCVELRPDFLAHVVLIVGIIVNIILAILSPVVAVISAIIQGLQAIEDALGTLGININIAPEFAEQQSLFNIWQDLITSINQRIIGCGRKHPSPFVRSYIQNVCDKCGIQFVSSIYNDPNSQYYNAMYLNAPVKKGTLNESDTYIDENHPIKTLDLFLDDLKAVHNADWKLINGIIYFERIDFFYSGAIWVNFETEDTAGTIQGKLCLEWRDDKKPSYINLEYSLDSVDPVGGEALNIYNNIVEWNLPFSELQSGHTDVLLPFATPRFRDDDIDEDILGQYSWAPFGLGDQINNFQSVLILAKGIAFQPKLLIWDGVDINFARVQTYELYNELYDPPQLFSVINKNYNYPYMFGNENILPNTVYPQTLNYGTLYSRFYTINNPKVYTDSGKSFTFTIRYNCASLQSALTAQWVQLPQGVGRITEMQINLDKKEILVSGNV